MKAIISTLLILFISSNAIAALRFHKVVRHPERYKGQKIEWRGTIRDILIKDGKTYMKITYEPFGVGDRTAPSVRFFIACYDGEVKEHIMVGTKVKIRGIFIDITGKMKIDKKDKKEIRWWISNAPYVEARKCWSKHRWLVFLHQSIVFIQVPQPVLVQRMKECMR